MCICTPGVRTMYCGKFGCTQEDWIRIREKGKDVFLMEDVEKFSKLGNIMPLPTVLPPMQWEIALRTFREMGLTIIETKELQKLQDDLKDSRTWINDAKQILMRG